MAGAILQGFAPRARRAREMPCRYLYSPSCREEAFWETELPIETVRKVSDASAMYPFGSPKGYYFSPFWPPYTDQIHGRSVARTPFRTVSLGNLVNRGNQSPGS